MSQSVIEKLCLQVLSSFPLSSFLYPLTQLVQFLLPPLRWTGAQGAATTWPPAKGLSPPNRQVRLFTLGLAVRASWPKPDRSSDILLLVSSRCLPLRQTPASQTGWAGVPVVAGGPTPPDVCLTDRPLPLRQGQQACYASPRFLVRRCATPIEVILAGVYRNEVVTEVILLSYSRY